MKKITAELLPKDNACANQVKLFKSTFGEEAVLNQHNLELAVKAGLHVLWLASLLPPPLLERYEAARELSYKQYEVVEKPLVERYKTALQADQDDTAWRSLWGQNSAAARPLWRQHVADVGVVLLGLLQEV